MEKFLSDLRGLLEKYSEDITVFDDYEVDKEFIALVISEHFAKEKTKILAIEDIQVFDGPNISPISITLSIRFQLTILPHFNIEDTSKMNIFVKIPIFSDGQTETAANLCEREVQVYRKFFTGLKSFLDHPIKGPYEPPIPKIIFRSDVETSMADEQLRDLSPDQGS